MQVSAVVGWRWVGQTDMGGRKGGVWQEGSKQSGSVGTCAVQQSEGHLLLEDLELVTSGAQVCLSHCPLLSGLLRLNQHPLSILFQALHGLMQA